MTPDQVKSLVEAEFPELVIEPRISPDGWSFFLGVKRGGARSNRIFRAVANRPNQEANLKFAVTDRLGSGPPVPSSLDPQSVKERISAEIELYRAEFASSQEAG